MEEDINGKAIEELKDLADYTTVLEGLKRNSENHIRWIAKTRRTLEKLFGRESDYFRSFVAFTWSKQGQFMIGGPARPAESFDPQKGIDRVNQEAYINQLGEARGLLFAAADHMGEDGNVLKIPHQNTHPPIIPLELITKLPRDVQDVCNEFNFVHAHSRPIASLLLLRRLLPLSVVRKFQIIDKESEVIINGECMTTKELLGGVEKLLKEKRIYRELINYKCLVDSSQHSFTFNVRQEDVEGAAVKLRLLLEDLFS